MKVLFVCSGNKKYNTSPIVKAQGESLSKQNVRLNYYFIKGKGFKGYLKNLLPLRREIKRGNYDIIHSHYGDSSLLAGLANLNKVKFVASFMGTDTYLMRRKVKCIYEKIYNVIFSILYKIIAKYFVHTLIIKSQKMKYQLWPNTDSVVIPNGVNFDIFKPLVQIRVKNNGVKKVLFVGDKNRKEKNFNLLESSITLLKEKFDIQIINPTNLSAEQINIEYNRAHLLALTSYYEGSPNVVKEAMACNLPIVSTDVGDVRGIFGKTDGCFIAKNNSIDFSEKLEKALRFKGFTKGRERLIDLGLDTKSVSDRLIKLYNKRLDYHN